MSNAILISGFGGPEVLSYKGYTPPKPARGEVVLRHKAIGLNFIDTYFRSGLYQSPNGLPFIPGNEGAGIVEELGEGVKNFQVGDRVAYAGALGSYTQVRTISTDNLVKLPDGVSEEQAACVMLKGMTAGILLRKTYAVSNKSFILYHAAAGGVGQFIGPWADHLGATVIGTVGSPEKVEIAHSHNYHHVINYRGEDWVSRVKEITGGKGCHVVYDGVGKDTFHGSLDSLRPLGMFVSFGQSSGPLPDFNTSMLAQRGSLFVTRPRLFDYIAERKDLLEVASDLFTLISKGVLKVSVNHRYPLADASLAHRELEARRTTGSTVLIP
ncbi:quinone oxidoreductase family protein [Flexibacterium corallicola]|uniref:quinone oxidoreductase family protein n=1 Tax=Flexibacterium corallicola TaxID=3037259 RepID=UPI00286F649A|nr:quinone oxidoreductase [Pseudovibrio sp. M1P-2-3]